MRQYLLLENYLKNQFKKILPFQKLTFSKENRLNYLFIVKLRTR